MNWPVLSRQFPGISDELTNFSLYLSDFASASLLLGATFWLGWRGKRPLEVKILTVPMTLLVSLAALSVSWSLDVLLAMQTTIRLLFLLSTSLILVRLRPDVRTVRYSMAISLGVQSAIAALQFWRQKDLGLQLLGEQNIAPYPGGGSILVTDGAFWLRGYGLTPHPNILGGLLLIFILTLIAPYLQARPRKRPLWLVLLLVGSVGLFFSFSRSAWLGGITGGLFIMVTVRLHRRWRENHWRSLVALALVAGLLLLGLVSQHFPLVKARFSPGSSPQETRSITEREALVEAAWSLIRLSPLTGIGAGNFAAASLPLVSAADAAPQPVHNMPLLLIAELGPAGGVLWAWLMVLPLGLALHRLRRDQLTLWGLGLTASLIAFGVIDLFDYYAWGWAQGRALRWLYWGLWGAEMAPNESVLRP
jgi:O-antigen ligase